MVPGLNASTAWTCGSLDNRVRKSVIGGEASGWACGASRGDV